MKIKIIMITCFLFLVSCSPKGYWLSEGKYRPKKPNYELSKEEFKETNLVSTNFVYLSSDSLITSKGTLKSAIGFNSNGEAFLNSYDSSDILNQNRNKNSIETAQEIGLYRVYGNEIKFERLTSSDYGKYVLWEGYIQGDTIYLTYNNWPSRIKEYVYIKSKLPKKSN